MIRRPPRSTPLSLHDALPISGVCSFIVLPLCEQLHDTTGGTSISQQRKHRSEEHTSELQSRLHLVCRLLLEKKKKYHSNGRALYAKMHELDVRNVSGSREDAG